ncbi:MAG TPA: hypothetical protein VN692_02060, partial [Steroidobacteraceae bacterium]|nr:hypothetical protein [Steroidobacteraceae bacterium]
RRFERISNGCLWFVQRCRMSDAPMPAFEDGSAFESNEAGDGNSRDECPSIEKLEDRAVGLNPVEL